MVEGGGDLRFGEGGDLGVVAAMGDVVADHGPSHADGGADQDRRQGVPRQLAEAGAAMIRGYQELYGTVSNVLRRSYSPDSIDVMYWQTDLCCLCIPNVCTICSEVCSVTSVPT